jgi:hypothetical protein
MYYDHTQDNVSDGHFSPYLDHCVLREPRLGEMITYPRNVQLSDFDKPGSLASPGHFNFKLQSHRELSVTPLVSIFLRTKPRVS